MKTSNSVIHLHLSPAYGRRYKTGADALKDWKDGKDFKITNGPYCSVRDTAMLIRDYGVTTLVFYNDMPALFYPIED